MDSVKFQNNREWKERAFLLGMMDFLSVAVIYFFALMLRFDFSFTDIE